MKKVKLFMMLALAIFFVICFCACNNNGDSGTTTPDQTTDGNTPDNTTSADVTTGDPNCEHAYGESVVVAPALALKDGEKVKTCSKCGHEVKEAIPMTKSLKILALGNSFTIDPTWHLWGICNDASIDVIVANLYIGNCTLDKHWNNISNNLPAYSYYKNTNGTWVNTANYTVPMGLLDEEWDVIVMHQTSGSSGFENTYSHLNEIATYMKTNCKNKDVRLIWQFPWAYQSDSTHSEFPKYNRDQLNMYNMIKAQVQKQIVPNKLFDDIIPVGTTIQNLRSSYIGDTVTRDGYHLNYGFGRYTAALIWYAKITGGSVDIIDWVPTKYPTIPVAFDVMRESVKNALANPYEITPSKIATGVHPDPPAPDTAPEIDLSVTPQDFYEKDKQLCETNGVNLDDYYLLEWNYLENAYWACTSKTTVITPSSSSSTYKQDICTDRKYSTETEIPVGSIFICDPGWRYRFEIFPEENALYTGERPTGWTVNFYKLDANFLDGCKYITWAVTTNPKSDMSAFYYAAYCHVRVYLPNSVPKPEQKPIERPDTPVTPEQPEEVLPPTAYYDADKTLAAGKGVNLDDYVLLEWDFLENAYWNCTNRPGTRVPVSTDSTYNQDICSARKYSLEELPLGTIFITDPDWRYRIEIFPNATDKHTGTRPGAHAGVVYYVLDAAMMRGCTYLAWSVTTNPQSDISDNFAKAYPHLRIYVPKTAASATPAAAQLSVEINETVAMTAPVNYTEEKLYALQNDNKQK